jgi:hypothetical protein
MSLDKQIGFSTAVCMRARLYREQPHIPLLLVVLLLLGMRMLLLMRMLLV